MPFMFIFVTNQQLCPAASEKFTWEQCLEQLIFFLLCVIHNSNCLQVLDEVSSVLVFPFYITPVMLKMRRNWLLGVQLN